MSRRVRLAALAVAVAISSAPVSGSARSALTTAQSATISTIVRHAMARQRIPGLAIAVARDGAVLYSHGFGTAASGRHVDADTVFPIGSVSKQFTAACVMLLVRQGHIDLDAPIARYLPGAPHAEAVTVRELLDQTSGLPDYTEQPRMQTMLRRPLTVVLASRLLSLIADKPLQFRPGSRFRYSDTNYLLAGMLVRRVSGTPYPTFLRRHILSPLRLTHTQYLATSIPAGTDVSHGYQIVHGRIVELPRFTMSWARGAGALASDVFDLVAWDHAFFDGRVVNPRLVGISTTPPGLRGGSHYAFGWVIGKVAGRIMIWHNGGLPGAHAMNAVFPSSGLEIVVLDNLLDSSPEDVAREVFKALPEGWRY